MPKTCEHCGQPMVTFFCGDCEGEGWHYGRDETGNLTPVDCLGCDGARKVQRCVNRDCSSQQWYPASARELGMLWMVGRNGGA